MISTAMAQLKLNFDVEKLQHDLGSAKQHFQSAPQIGPYHDGSWTGIALRNSQGNYEDTLAFSAGSAQDTEVLSYCPYFKQIIDGFDFEVEVARLLFLPPGKKVGEHKDQGIDWSTGLARIHIPIITHEEVYFYIDGQRAQWKEGEFWYGNFSETHSIHNQSDITRVHLVLDCAINNNLLALFPKAFLTEIQSKSEIFINQDAIAVSLDTLKSCCGYFTLPKQYLGFPAKSELIIHNDQLAVKIFGLPVAIGLTPTAENTFEYLDTKFTYTHFDTHSKTIEINNQSKDLLMDIEIKSTLSSKDRLLQMSQIALFKTILTIASPFMKLRRRFSTVNTYS